MSVSPGNLAAMLSMLMLSATACLASIKTDVVEFGGSRMVGEIKRMDRGKLSFKTESTDTITIDWMDVTSLSTKQQLLVERRDGSVTPSLLLPDAPERHLTLDGGGYRENVSMDDVVAFEPLEDTTWDQLSATVSAGYSFTKSSEIENIDLSLTVKQRTTKRSRELSLYSNTSGSKSEEAETREGVSYVTLRNREDSPYFTGFTYSYESNDSLGLDYRILAAAIAGREFYLKPNQLIRPVAGFGATQERFTTFSDEQNVEVVLGTQIDWYEFSSPELDLSAKFLVFPGITDSGRIRSSVDISLRWEIIHNLFWQLSYYNDYDSDSPSIDLSSYGITTSVGWTWH